MAGKHILSSQVSQYENTEPMFNTDLKRPFRFEIDSYATCFRAVKLLFFGLGKFYISLFYKSECTYSSLIKFQCYGGE